MEIRTPHSFVICSEVFETFIEENGLQEFAILETDNDRIAARFVKAKIPQAIKKDLHTLLTEIRYPLAVRSSSLLEDSQVLPFAGLYTTYMLPNNHPNIRVRLKQLCNAVKLVFASVFYKSPKEYVKNSSFRIEEEKMAVIIQQVVGQQHQHHFYPVISGVAQSFNFYPISYMEPAHGIVELALGLGAIIADGGPSFRFSPRFPEMNPPYASPDDFLKRSQNYFYALSLSRPDITVKRDEKHTLKRLDLEVAERDGTLFFVAGTFSAEDNAIRDTIAIKGPRVVTFANVLKYNLFPLADILNEIFKIGCDAFGSHIELEFAVNLYKDKARKPEFYLLQIRPLVGGQEDIEVSFEENNNSEDWLCVSRHAMGNGVIDDVCDLVYVDPDTFELSRTRAIADEVGRLNQRFIEENKKYILIGFGRWGTNDPWLGIPVEWYQISRARVIVESNLDGFVVDPSQGSHFFHNLVSLKMGYLHIRKTTEEEYILWEWIRPQEPLFKGKYIRHIRTQKPLLVKLDGRKSLGVIFKT